MDTRSPENVFSFEQDDLLTKSMPILQELRKKRVFCDVVIKTGNQDQEFPAHRPVLAATIPYFYTMLTSEYVESKQREIIMKDIEPSILEALIDFSYSGKIKVEHHNVQNLMKAADFVGLDQVKNACAEYLISKIQVDNIFEIVQLADLLECQQLISAADDFINENFVGIAGTNEFLMLEFAELKELIGKDDMTCSEENIFEAAIKWVKHNVAERSSRLPEILSNLRFSLISIGYLVNVVSTEELIQSSSECLRIVDKAKNYHLLQCESKWAAKTRNSPKFSNIVPTVTGKQLKLYDVFKNEWLKEEPLNQNRSSSVIVSLGNKMCIIGGYGGNEHNFEIYDLETNTWSKGKNMVNGRYFLGATTLNYCIYVCGGRQGLNDLSSIDCYSLRENTWKTVASMKTKRYDVGVASLNGYVYVTGGFNNEQHTLGSCEKYDPKSNTWTSIKPLLQKRQWPGVAALNNKIYVCGGFDDSRDSYLNSCEVYDPSTDTWSYIPPMHERRHRPSVASFNGKLYAVAGFNGNMYLSSVEVYSPETNSWEMLHNV